MVKFPFFFISYACFKIKTKWLIIYLQKYRSQVKPKYFYYLPFSGLDNLLKVKLVPEVSQLVFNNMASWRKWIKTRLIIPKLSCQKFEKKEVLEMGKTQKFFQNKIIKKIQQIAKEVLAKTFKARGHHWSTWPASIFHKSKHNAHLRSCCLA